MTRSLLQSSQKWDDLKSLLGQYPWDFMGFIFLSLLIPRLYQLTNTYWIGHIDYSALAIAEQYEFVGILIEIVNETIPFGILALVSQNYKDKSAIIKQILAGVVLQFILSTGLTVLILLNMNQFVALIGTAPELIDQTVAYLSLRALALPFYSLALLLVIGLKSMDRPKVALGVVCINVLTNILLDVVLVAQLPFSLQLGLTGVALGYLLSNIIYFLAAALLVGRTLQLKRLQAVRASVRSQTAPIFGVGGWTGLDSLVRNVFYFFVLQILNIMGPNQYAGFQLFQRIMWTVLIPVIAISQGTSIRIGNYLKTDQAKQKTQNLLLISCSISFLILTGFGVLGIIGIDAMGYVFTNNPEVVRFSSIMFVWQIIPYILFAVAMNVRSVFFGTGKTIYILLISIVLNAGIIFPFFVVIHFNILPHIYETVMLMFVVVDVVDIVITFIFAKFVLKRLF